MSTPVTRQESDLSSLQPSQDVGIGRIAKRGLLAYLAEIRQPGHGIQPAPTNDSDLRLRQAPS